MLPEVVAVAVIVPATVEETVTLHVPVPRRKNNKTTTTDQQTKLALTNTLDMASTVCAAMAT
jgi:hypothetical protein